MLFLRLCLCFHVFFPRGAQPAGSVSYGAAFGSLSHLFPENVMGGRNHQLANARICSSYSPCVSQLTRLLESHRTARALRAGSFFVAGRFRAQCSAPRLSCPRLWPCFNPVLQAPCKSIGLGFRV